MVFRRIISLKVINKLERFLDSLTAAGLISGRLRRGWRVFCQSW